jgi:uncharacterized protein
MTTEFTPFASLIGGSMIGLSAVLYMVLHGRIAGISGIAARLFPPFDDNAPLNPLIFILGIVAAPAVYAIATGSWAPFAITASVPTMIMAGLLVGFGSVWGGGCTSGHGICGLSRLSTRSMVAVAVFMAVAAITVFITRHVAG